MVRLALPSPEVDSTRMPGSERKSSAVLRGVKRSSLSIGSKLTDTEDWSWDLSGRATAVTTKLSSCSTSEEAGVVASDEGAVAASCAQSELAAKTTEVARPRRRTGGIGFIGVRVGESQTGGKGQPGHSAKQGRTAGQHEHRD
jgi:hypothetical protein